MQLLLMRLRDEIFSATSGNAAIKAAVNLVYSRIGAPVGASISADLASAKSDTGLLVERTGSNNVKVWPTLLNEVVVTGGAGVWALGAAAAIVAPNDIGTVYYVDEVYITAVSGMFSGGELIFYHGAGATEFARVVVSNGPTSISVRNSKRIPANDKIDVKLATKGGGAETVSLKIGYHA